MLIDQIKSANIEALKAKDSDARAIYSVIINKYMLLVIERREKGIEVKDEELIQIIVKTLKELDDEEQNFLKVGNTHKVASIKNQVALLKKYLPEMLSEEEIIAEINKLDDKSIPSVMKHFKINFNGKVDMGLVNKIVRTL